MESMSAHVFTLQLCYCMYTAPLFADNLQNRWPKIVICCLRQIVETLLIGCEHSLVLYTTDAPMPLHSLLLSQLKCFTSERNPCVDWTGLSHLTTLPFSLSFLLLPLCFLLSLLFPPLSFFPPSPSLPTPFFPLPSSPPLSGVCTPEGSHSWSHGSGHLCQDVTY